MCTTQDAVAQGHRSIDARRSDRHVDCDMRCHYRASCMLIEVAMTRIVSVVAWVWVAVAAGWISCLPSPGQAPPTPAALPDASPPQRLLRRPAMPGLTPASPVTPTRRPASRPASTGRRRIRARRRRPRVRELPRSRAGARRRRRQRQNPEVRRDEAGGSQPRPVSPATTAARMPAGRAASTPRATCRARPATASTVRNRPSTSW